MVALLLNHRAFTTLENRITVLESSTGARFIAMENRLETIRREAREDRLQLGADIQNLTGKVLEIDNRLTRIEERIGPR